MHSFSTEITDLLLLCSGVVGLLLLCGLVSFAKTCLDEAIERAFRDWDNRP